MYFILRRREENYLAWNFYSSNFTPGTEGIYSLIVVYYCLEATNKFEHFTP